MTNEVWAEFYESPLLRYEASIEGGIRTVVKTTGHTRVLRPYDTGQTVRFTINDGASAKQWRVPKAVAVAHLGAISEGYRLIQLDGDYHNAALSNLKYATSAEVTEIRRARVNVCSKGHARIPENVYERSDGALGCRICRNNKSLAHKVRNRTGDLGPGCEICSATDVLSWDHDHTTGEYRGTLCRSCNSGIGFLKDDPALVERALQYLRKETQVDA